MTTEAEEAGALFCRRTCWRAYCTRPGIPTSLICILFLDMYMLLGGRDP
jgi:hypothetical protein